MSTPPEKIVANYDSKSKQSKLVAAEMKKIVERYKGKRITKENVCVLVSTLMLQANNLKTISGPDKKELVTFKILFKISSIVLLELFKIRVNLASSYFHAYVQL